MIDYECKSLHGNSSQRVRQKTNNNNIFHEITKNDDSYVDLNFQSFQEDHRKVYTDHNENRYRRNVFKQNLRFPQKNYFNLSYKVTITAF